MMLTKGLKVKAILQKLQLRLAFEIFRVMDNNILYIVQNLLERDSLCISDLNDGFIFLQILALVSPEAVDLTWYTTDEALRCSNISGKAYKMLLDGINHIKTAKEFTVNDSLLDCAVEHIQMAANGDETSLMNTLTSLHQILILKTGKQSPNPTLDEPHDYIPSDSTFLAQLRWILNICLGYIAKSPVQNEMKKLTNLLKETERNV
jgi:hypothetical protein